MDEACPILFVIEFVNASATTVSTRIVLERGDQNVILMYHPCLTVVWVSWVFYFYGYFQWADSWSDLLPTAGPLPVASFWHLFRLHYPWPGPRALTRAPSPNAVIAPQHPRHLSATPSNCAGRTRARANPVPARLRSTSRDSSRATRLPAFLRRLHPDTPNPRASRSCCAF